MVKQLIISPLLLLVVSFSFAQSDVAKSNRIVSVIEIDGDASDWHLPLRFYDSNTRLFFDFYNDDNNLFLCFQSQNEVDQRKIMRAGVTITLSTKGKGKSKASIKFPLQRAATDNADTSAQINNSMSNKNSFSTMHSTMEVKGFKTKDGIIAVNDPSGINVAMDRDINKKLTYEIAIPLKELSGDNYIEDFTKQMELEVEVHALKQNGSGGERNFSGGGGMHRNSTNGESKPGDLEQDENNKEFNPDRAAMFEKTKFKQKFTLAIK